MTKKEYILKILEYLKDEWEPAKGLGIVIWELQDERLLEAMYKVFNKVLKKINDKKLREKINISIYKMREIRKEENYENIENLQELEQLEESLLF